MKILSSILGLCAMAIMLFAGPRGLLFISKPERGQVTRTPGDNANGPTARGRGPSFIWLGGGYRGGK